MQIQRTFHGKLIFATVAALAVACAPPAAEEPAAVQYPNHPEFRPAAEQGPMPDSVLVVKRTPIAKAKYPAVDFHFHGGRLKTAEDYARMVDVMDQAGVGVISNMDAGFGENFDQHMRASEGVRDRFQQFARVNFEGINEPGWSDKAAAELDRCFRAGAAGLKISKRLGLDVKNADGSYVQCDDPRMDPIWEMCARHDKPVMIHVNDSAARFQPVSPRNERWEAGQWRQNVDGNYYAAGFPDTEEIFAARERMLDKHPNTRFIHAHIALLGFDLPRVAALLDKYPNSDIELSARLQEIGRQPYSGREFLLKYQDRILFGTDGDPGREVEQFWTPHWRYFETNDEYFNHPAQMLSPTGAPLQGRWAIHGAYLPDEVLRKIYYENALRHLPGARASIERQLAQRGTD